MSRFDPYRERMAELERELAARAKDVLAARTEAARLRDMLRKAARLLLLQQEMVAPLLAGDATARMVELRAMAAELGGP